MKQILLTGMAGFIGSHLTEAILRDPRFKGYSLVGLDNFDPYYDKSVKLRNMAAFRKSKRVKFIEGFSGNEKLLDQIFKRHAIEGVIHLAARAGVGRSLKEPAEYSRLNIEGSVALFHKAGLAGVKQFLFASSSSVYGSDSKTPFRESDLCLHPLSPYAATKRAGELLCWNAHHLHGLPFTALRFFTVYGPRQRPEMAIAKFTRAILEGKPVVIYGKGEMTRDFTFIDDIVSGLLNAYFWKKGQPHFEILNLGNSRAITVKTLVDKLEKAIGKKAKRQFLPTPAGEMPATFADIRKAKKYLDFSPKTRIDDGIVHYLEWLRRDRLSRA